MLTKFSFSAESSFSVTPLQRHNEHGSRLTAVAYLRESDGPQAV